MEAIFLQLMNMSITAGWLTLAVFLLRFVLKKAPKAIICSLWALVAIRLIFPLSFESVLSLIPSSQTIPKEILYTAQPMINTGLPVLNNAINPVLSQTMAPAPGASVNPMQVILSVASVIWLVGMAVMALYALISYLRLRHLTQESVQQASGIWLCDRIPSPFILGILRPRIYLPSSMDPADATFVIAHENAHLRRKDHWWKPLGFALLTIYWFNPVLWLAYILLCRDIELACDEKVIHQLGTENKKPYSQALINCSVPRRMISACPLAFGEVSIKSRIKSVLNYKKPAFWVMLAAVVISIAAAVCFLTDPPKAESPPVGPKTTVILGCGPASDIIWDSIILSENDAVAVASVLDTPTEGSRWESGVNRAMCYFFFIVNNKYYGYAEQEGLFNDYEKERCLYLGETDKTRINGIIEQALNSATPTPDTVPSIEDPRAFVYFYPYPMVAAEEMTVTPTEYLRFALLTQDSLAYLQSMLNRSSWIPAAYLKDSDRLAIQYDGQFQTGYDSNTDWIHFSLEDKLLHWNDQYLQLSEGDITFLRDILARASVISNTYHAKKSAESTEYLDPYFSLGPDHFQLGYSPMSWALFGTYFFNGSLLTLSTEEYQYVFTYDGTCFTYIESRSTPCDNFRFQDGAVFYLHNYLLE